MQAVQIAIDNSDLSPKDSVLTVFNPCPFPRSGVISAYIDMPQGMDYSAFSVRTPDGKEVSRLQVKERDSNDVTAFLTAVEKGNREAAEYLQNHKRTEISHLESEHDLTIQIIADRNLGWDECRIETTKRETPLPPAETACFQPPR